MSVGDLSYFSMLRQRLGHLGERQNLIAENLANVSTPGYTPRDVDDRAFKRALASVAPSTGRITPARTQDGHMPAPALRAPAVRTVSSPDSETTLDGNQVVLEDQLLKAGETRQAMETSLALYQKGLAMIRLASRAPR